MLKIAGLTKRFGGVTALEGVDMEIAPGRVHALLGENGAGKSTLLKCLSGVHRPDAGSMSLFGEPFAPHDPHAAERAGLRFVHQELNLVPGFTAYENAFVGRAYPRRMGVVDWRAMRARMAAVRDRHGLDLDIDVPVGRLSVAKCQLVEILRALMDEARVLVFDEPTASLSEAEAATLRHVVRNLAAGGCAIVFVSHRLDEVFEVADSYTVLRNGRLAGDGALAETSRDAIVAMMAGEAFVHERTDYVPAPSDGTVLALSDFRISPVRPPMDFAVGPGEIVGLYGIIGSGRSSLLKSIWGANPLAHGTITIDGAPLDPAGIQTRIGRGVAFVPEDRRNTGLIMHFPVIDNVALPRLGDYRATARLPVVSWRRLRGGARETLAGVKVRYRGLGDRIATLSGGNQQKVLIGRWFGRRIRLFLLDEPTRGVDVRSKAEIHQLCRDVATQGAAVIFATSDIEELFMLASRIVVLADGRVTLDAPNRDISRQALLDATFRASSGSASAAR